MARSGGDCRLEWHRRRSGPSARDVARDGPCGAGDPEGAIRHLERAVAIAKESGGASARCEALARLAQVAAGLITDRGSASEAGEGSHDGESDLADLVERSAAQVKELLAVLPGHAPWGAQADAALATVALRRGDLGAAVASADAALQALQDRDPRGHQPRDRPSRCAGPTGRRLAGCPGVRPWLPADDPDADRPGHLDESIRVQWLRGPVGRELVESAGPLDTPAPMAPGNEAVQDATPHVDDTDRQLLRLLTEGRTNAEIADELRLDEERRRAAAGAAAGAARGVEPRRGDIAGLPRPGSGRVSLMAIRARVERHKCVGAGNCITLAPTAFDWLAGDFGKADVVGADSVDEEVLRAAAFACPTAAIVLEDV